MSACFRRCVSRFLSPPRHNTAALSLTLLVTPFALPWSIHQAVYNTGVTLLCPLWQLAPSEVLAALDRLHIKALISCVNVVKFKPATTTQVAAAACEWQEH